ncbi:MAG: site-specific integrase, partial [Candidatus Levybacteria bacterium]|nr:site-specific integrase [Candidatus Levybacteria bacterium]
MQPIKLSDAHTLFKNYLKDKKHSNATILAYGKDIEQLISFLEELSKLHIHDVQKEDIEAFLAKLAKDGYTPKSISRKLNSTRTFYRFLKIQEYVTDDPSFLVSHPRYELAPPRILRPTEYRALRDAARNDPRMYAIIELLLQTGIRIGELANLTLDDVKDTELHIAPQEGHDERMVPLNKAAKDALIKYLEVRGNGGSKSLFITKTGKPLLIRNIRT